MGLTSSGTDGLSAANLENYQVIALCNVATLPDSFVGKLSNYLRQGGGLLIFAGDKLQADPYNQKLTQLLPAALRDKKGDTAGAQADRTEYARLQDLPNDDKEFKRPLPGAETATNGKG